MSGQDQTGKWKAKDKRLICSQMTYSIHIADIAADQPWITSKIETNDNGQ